jgi:hypothetical protein
VSTHFPVFNLIWEFLLPQIRSTPFHEAGKDFSLVEIPRLQIQRCVLDPNYVDLQFELLLLWLLVDKWMMAAIGPKFL